ncbi:outer membrane protein assembly factor BamB family protein [Nocardiopsis coralliicola]
MRSPEPPEPPEAAPPPEPPGHVAPAPSSTPAAPPWRRALGLAGAAALAGGVASSAAGAALMGDWGAELRSPRLLWLLWGTAPLLLLTWASPLPRWKPSADTAPWFAFAATVLAAFAGAQLPWRLDIPGLPLSASVTLYGGGAYLVAGGVAACALGGALLAVAGRRPLPERRRRRTAVLLPAGAASAIAAVAAGALLADVLLPVEHTPGPAAAGPGIPASVSKAAWVWEETAQGSTDMAARPRPRPLAAPDGPVVQVHGGAVGLDPATGAERWSYRDDRESRVHPVAGGAGLRIQREVDDRGQTAGTVLSTATGQPWPAGENAAAGAVGVATDEMPPSAAAQLPSDCAEPGHFGAVHAQNTVVYQLECGEDGGALVGIDPESGAQIWRHDHGLAPLGGPSDEQVHVSADGAVALVEGEPESGDYAATAVDTDDGRVLAEGLSAADAEMASRQGAATRDSYVRMLRDSPDDGYRFERVAWSGEVEAATAPVGAASAPRIALDDGVLIAPSGVQPGTGTASFAPFGGGAVQRIDFGGAVPRGGSAVSLTAVPGAVLLTVESSDWSTPSFVVALR